MSKCMIFWLRARSRTPPRMVGLATAAGSVHTLDTFFRAAREGRGRLFVVDGKNAAEGRAIIAKWRKGEPTGAGMSAVIEGPDRIVAIGSGACLAIGGASFKAQCWDDRIRSQGRVTIEQSRALNSTTPDEYTLQTAFGQGLGGKR